MKNFQYFNIARVGYILFTFILTITSTLFAANSNVSISLIANKSTVSPGDTVTIGIEHKLRPGWHIYWVNPGDSGEPTQITWSGLDNLRVSDISWPIPKKINIGPLTNYGYERKVTLLQDITLPQNFSSREILLTADIFILVCKEECIPEQHSVSIEFNSKEVPNSQVNPLALNRARESLPINISRDSDVYYFNDGANVRFSVKNFDQLNIPVSHISSLEVFPYQKGLIKNSAPLKADLTDNILTLAQNYGELVTSEIQSTKIVLSYLNSKGNKQAYMFDAKYDIGSKMNTVDISLLVAIIFALLGGMILNLMPCVFPILSIKALSLMTLKNQDESAAKRHGWTYTTGVISSMLCLATILVIFKATGAQIGWGFQLQNSLVITLLIFLMLVLGLLLLGFINIRTVSFNIGGFNAGSYSTKSSFFTGVLATIVATPCTAPFMGAALGYALLQPAYVALLIFVSLGFGLALPYLLLCYFPFIRFILPKPGMWMEHVKQALSFPLFLTLVWLVWVLSAQQGNNSVAVILVAIVLVLFGFWIHNVWPHKKMVNRIGSLIIIISILSSCFYVYNHNQLYQSEIKSNTYKDFSSANLKQALASKQAVFVNMTAAWCITCKVNEQLVLSTESIQDKFKENNIIYLKGDWTNYNAEITLYLESFRRSGVPIYVYYGTPNENTGIRPPPIVLPQVLTKTKILNIIN